MSTDKKEVHIPCHACMAVNRVPVERLSSRPKCGKCKVELLPAAPIVLDDRHFDKYVQKCDLPVVVDFWASWCGPCKMMAPVFEDAAGRWQGKAVFAKVNTEQAVSVSSRMGIRSIPSLLVMRNGQEVTRQAGAMPPAQLEHWLKSVL